jgi:hypothetical protein
MIALMRDNPCRRSLIDDGVSEPALWNQRRAMRCAAA